MGQDDGRSGADAASRSDATAAVAGTWDDLRVGQTVGPLRHRITPAMVAAFAAATGDGSRHADATMPATLLATDYVLLLHDTLQLGHGLMARHETRSWRPVQVGTEVEVVGTVIDKYERKGRHYWTMRYEVRQEGTRCIDYSVTCTVD